MRFPPVLAAGVYLNGAFIFGIMRILLIYASLPLGSSYHYGVCQNKPPNYGALVMLIMPDFFFICKPTYPTYATCGGIILRPHDGSMTLFLQQVYAALCGVLPGCLAACLNGCMLLLKVALVRASVSS